MRVKHLLLFAGISLFFINNDALAIDSISINYKIKPVKIGPEELNPLDLIEPEILRKMQIETLLKSRSKQLESIKSYQKKLLLRAALAGNEILDEPALKAMLEQHRLAGNLKGMASIGVRLGVLYAGKGELGKAIYSSNEALGLYEMLKDRPSVIRAVQNVAALYKADGQLSQAVAKNKDIIQLSPGIDNFTIAGNAYLEIAEINFLQKRHNDAEDILLKKALPMFRRVGNKIGRMRCFQSLASLYFVQKRYTEAKWFNIQANIMADKLDDRHARIENLIKLAEVKFAIGETDMAITDFRQAEALALEHQNLISLVKIKGDLGEIYHSLGDFTAAGAELKEYNRLSTSLFKTAEL